MHSALTNFVLLKQFPNKTNDVYLTKFKSMVQTLILAGGEHVLVSAKMIEKPLGTATIDEINEEKE